MLTLQNTEAIRRIEEAIGYTFNDKRLLIQVLTRKTYLKIDPEAPDNEVLEFYGDTLMNYHVTNYFMSKYAHMLDDGLFFMRTVEQFTDMRSHYVCNRYLTDRIKAMGLARYLRAQNRDTELRRDGEKAYADIFESLVGAIYLDSYQNDTLIRAFILRQLGIEPKRSPADIEAFDYDSLTVPVPAETAPVALEEPETIADLPAVEAAVEEIIPSPVAAAAVAETVPAEEEVPAPTVEAPVSEAKETAEVSADATPEITAEVPAEDTAATAVTAALPIPVVEAVTAVAVVKTKQEALADFCRQWGFEQPTYGETPPNAPNARPVAACTLKYKDAKGKLVKISLNDSGRTLAEATEKAAAKMLKKLEKQRADALAKEQKAAEKPVTAPQDETPAEPVKEQIEVPAPEVKEEAPIPTAEVAVEVPEAETTEAPQAADPEAETAQAEVETKEEIIEAEPAAAEAVTEDESQAIEEQIAAVLPAVETVPFEDLPIKQTFEYVEETAPAQQEIPAPEPAPEEEFIQQTMILTMEGAPAEATAPGEEPTVSEDVKPAKNSRKKKPAVTGEGSEEAKPKRSSSRKKTAPAEDRPAEEGIVTNSSAESSAEPSAEEAAEKAVKEAKPRTRKPRAKKANEGDGDGNSAEGEQGETK